MSVPVAPHLRSSEQHAYNATVHSSLLDWTKNCLLIRGKPVTLISAEFQYFRVPDRERWRPLLLQMKAMGFNAVRLYVHWGYHSPAEGVYNFRGNRDIEYLLQLCAQLQLYVITAPGPYICAEVQAGGFPIWLIAKRNIRIRHMTMPPIGLCKKWDENFHKYCVDYMRKIVPILVKYELTTNANGCVIAMQIENELRERPTLGVGGLDDEIRLLCEVARQCGSTVPFFHNDDSPIGSWSAGAEYRSAWRAFRKTGIKAYRTDLYGFDLYFTFPPGDRSGDLSSKQVGMLEAFGVSSCLNCCGVGGIGLGGSETKCLSCLYETTNRHSPPPALGWADANQMEAAVDTLGKKLDNFGGSATYAPTFCAEAQVGWINQWGRFRTYDDTYNFFGDQFSATLQLSLMAQGITFINHYIAYGGTNHGTVGDTEVYSSYDYSAFIREFGLLSGRGRVMRQAMLFARSFADCGFSDTVFCKDGKQGMNKLSASVKSTVPTALIAVRQPEGPNPYRPKCGNTTPKYAYLRNLKHDQLRFNLIVNDVVLPCHLVKAETMVVPLYHNLSSAGLSVFACTVPIICRTEFEGSEMWVLRIRRKEVGRLVLNVQNKESTGRKGVAAKWALVVSHEQSSDTMSSGEILATDQDPGAATSLLQGPLEKLPLAGQESLGGSGKPFAVRTSTESIGTCFSFSFNVQDSCAISIRDLSEEGSLVPVVRLLCLTEMDASTFTADLSGNDVFEVQSTPHRFSAAWGAHDLAFNPPSTLSVGFAQQDEKSTLFLLREKSSNEQPESFQSCPLVVLSVLPGLFAYKIPENSLATALKQGMGPAEPLSTQFEVPINDWSMRMVDWRDDVSWRRISYENRDPLDHHMTSGHIAYRLKFRSSSQRGSLILNIRHSAVVWCNGMAVGSQIVYSHNMFSAGAMHAFDILYAGKKRYDLSKAMQEKGPEGNGFHEVLILVLSLGQSRSPFLLNDVRNKRGLLSARLSRGTKASDVSWELAGVDVTRTDDAYGTSGLPLEDDVNTSAYDIGFTTCVGPEIKADSGLVYYRGTFRVPPSSVVSGTTKYPLRIKVFSGARARAMIWVNTLFMGRYIEELGPQTDFYVPDGLIKQCKGNTIAVAVYGPVDTNISFRILPWVVDSVSGNLDEKNGQVYALRSVNFELNGEKGRQCP